MPSAGDPATQPNADARSCPVPAPAGRERAVVWTLWLTYGAFYFCRTNISVAVPGLKAPVSEGGLGLASDEVGWILAALKIAYGLGQLVNGQFSERFSPRVMLAVGMFGSAALNVLFGAGTGFFFLLFVWATNGFCQSLGWTPCVRVAANWVPIARRGNAIGIIGTGYQITLGLTYVVAGQAEALLGWRGALWVPAALLAAAGVFMLVCLRDQDERTEQDHPAAAAGSPPRVSFVEGLYWTLYNPTLWVLGLALGLLNACRYGFLDWGVTHLMETQETRIDKATLQFFVIAIGATAGSYLAGWATDRFFHSRRGPVVCILMAALGCLSLVYDSVVSTSVTGTMLLLVVIGFCIYGPQVLLVGTAPADLAHRGTSAAAAGFVNFIGYMGAATGDVVTGYYSAPEHGGWRTAILIWAGWAFAGAAITALLWNTTSRKVGLVPPLVPKVAAVALLLLAGGAVVRDGGGGWLPPATFAAALTAAGALVGRLAAAPALLVSLCGLVAVFLAGPRGEPTGNWNPTVAMVSYGLAAIAATMILVEKKDERCA